MSGPTSIESSEDGPSSKHKRTNSRSSKWPDKLHGRFKNRDIPDTAPPFSTPQSTSPQSNDLHRQSEECQDTDITTITGPGDQSGSLVVNARSSSPRLKLVAVVQWIKARQAYLRTAEKDIYDQARIIIASRRISRLRDTPAENDTQRPTDGYLDVPLQINTSNRQAEGSSETSTEDRSPLSDGVTELPVPSETGSSVHQPNRDSVGLVPEEDTKDGDDADFASNNFENGMGSLPSPPISESDDSDDAVEVIPIFSARPPPFITNRHCLPRSEREGAPSPVERLRD